VNSVSITVTIYTDGSAYEGGVGAAAVLTRPRRPPRKIQLHLGETSKYTVYTGEVTGLLLGAHLLCSETRGFDTVLFAVDNQATVQSFEAHKPAPSHMLLDAFEKRLKNLSKRRKDLKVKILWIPGHEGVEGNEIADSAAKDAASGTSSPGRQLPKLLRKTLPASKAAVKMALDERLSDRAARWWRSSPRFNRAKLVDPDLPSKKFIQATKDWPRLHTSILLQLRTGHAPLRKHLHRIGKVDSPLCPYCQLEDETVLHFLVKCPALATKHDNFFALFFRNARKASFLLTNAKAMKQVVKFALASKRFQQERRIAAPPETSPEPEVPPAIHLVMQFMPEAQPIMANPG
jgi:ribonuclease HI